MNSPSIRIKHVHLHLPPLSIGSAALLASMGMPKPKLDPSPDQRFQLSDDSTTVTDHRTGLMWTREESPKRLTFAEAESYCTELRTGGFTDWRLPDLEELESIRDLTRHEPCIDTSAFNSNSSWVWSRTPTAWSPDCAWIVYFYRGYVHYNHRDDNAFVRAVRRVSPAGQ